MKIFLVGMPGSGKSTLGKQAAEFLGAGFVDLDAEVEKSEGKSIPEIFSGSGEEYFRQVEARLLREWAASTLPFVMATGGGAPCFHGGMDIINEHGISVFLDCTVDELVERVKRNRERPLLLSSDEEELRKKLNTMLSTRKDCYSKAKIILHKPSLESLLKELRIRR